MLDIFDVDFWVQKRTYSIKLPLATAVSRIMVIMGISKFNKRGEGMGKNTHASI